MLTQLILGDIGSENFESFIQLIKMKMSSLFSQLIFAVMRIVNYRVTRLSKNPGMALLHDEQSPCLPGGRKRCIKEKIGSSLRSRVLVCQPRAGLSPGKGS